MKGFANDKGLHQQSTNGNFVEKLFWTTAVVCSLSVPGHPNTSQQEKHRCN